MKVATACRECRLGKRKCGEAKRGVPCSPCNKRGLACSLAAPVRRHPVPIQPPPATVVKDESVQDLDWDLVKRLVELYLKCIHDKPHTLFHPPTLLRAVDDQALAPQVLYGILCITARFLPQAYSDVRAACRKYYEKATSSLKSDLDRLSIENVQACILIGNYCGVECLPQLESLYVGKYTAGLACKYREFDPYQHPYPNLRANMRLQGIGLRTALIMNLPVSPPDEDDIQKEVRLRVWWSLYMIDRWGSAGHHLPRQLPDHGTNSPPLPMDELYFSSLRPGSHDSADATRPGLWGRMVQLAHVFTKVHDLHRARVQGSKSHKEAEDRTYELAMELDSWSLSLPGHILPTPENMRHHARQGLGSAFVALHMGYYHYMNLLYFPFLDLQLDKTPTQRLFADRCEKSAAAFSDFLVLSDEIDGCEVIYFIVAHMTAVSSAALLHVLMFGHEAELPATRRRLESNFKVLVKLRSYWPAVALLMERLFTFQRNCMRSTDPNTHKADSWMIGFLLDHARPVSEKVDSPQLADSATSHMLQRDRVAADTLSLLRE